MNAYNKIITLVLLPILLISITSCQKKPPHKSFIILSINDVYRTEGLDDGKIGGLARVKTLRDDLIESGQPVLLLHAGDFLQPSFSSRINQGEAMIDVMNQLDGKDNEFDSDMIVTFGNHEFDKSKLEYLPRLQQRIDESEFLWLDSNINWLRDADLGKIHSNNLRKWTLKQMGGITVGLFSLTTNMTHPKYIASFDDPVEVTKHYVPFLKSKGADIVIALTHQQLSDDKLILNLPQSVQPDLIIGGHEHYRQIEQVNNHWIIKADADALSAAVVTVSMDNGSFTISPTFKDLDENTKPNPRVLQSINNWSQKTSVKYCSQINQDPSCLDEAYGTTKVELIAEESEIRRFETNMGNYIADTALNEFKICKADIALVNSGSVRLNYNISAGSNITRKHMEGMFPYPSDLQLIQINGKTLKQMITHSIDKWTANGHWLLVSGIKFNHNPESQEFNQLRWSHNNQLIHDNQTLTAIVPHYLIDAKTDHDGYDMINETMVKECDKNGANLKNLVINRIKHTANGINPQIDGRICNTLRNECK